MCKLKFSFSLAGVVVVAASLTSGCVTTTEGQGALVGGLVGSGIGALACKDDRAKCALIGGAVGAGVGYAAGTMVAKEQKKYASMEQYYEAELAKTLQFNEELKKENKNLKKGIKQDKSKIAALKKRFDERLEYQQAMIADMEKKGCKNTNQCNKLKSADKKTQEQYAIFAKSASISVS